MKACVPPVDLSEIFTLANTYLKLKIAPGNGLGSTFVTAADNVDKKEWQKRYRRKLKSKGKKILKLRRMKRSSTLHTYQVNTIGMRCDGKYS
jgi:hypothetical protein